jgi:glycerate kinase
VSRPARILIVPDKFKGTLSAPDACAAIAAGWASVRPDDRLELLPMSDGGDGFGEVMAELLNGRARPVKTLDAAHRPITAHWWRAGRQKLAIIESARVIGLATLPLKKFHPFQLDTFGLGKILEDAVRRGVKECLIGIGGSATNDGGFGLARALGWRFLDPNRCELDQWWQLNRLDRVVPPARRFGFKITVAVDVANPLLGPRGCTRVYGPQKGLQPEDFAHAESCLRRLATVLKRQFGLDFASVPGAGAAGGLGFGLMAFAGARPKSGFEVFARAAGLEKRIRRSDLVITGEGAMDRQTCMGKGVGEVLRLCRKANTPCIALAGKVKADVPAGKRFVPAFALAGITTLRNALNRPKHYLKLLSAKVAGRSPVFGHPS